MNTLAIVQIYNLVIMSSSLSPCPVGFLPPECIHECQDGHYGVNCLSLCSATCMNVSCRPQSGECYRCQIGFFGPMCSEKCKPGFHGVNCSKTCPPNCLNRLCDPFSGFCLDCVNGYSGSHCETLQRLQSVVAYVNADTAKESNDHTVLYISIIVVTLTLPVCTVTLWVYILKRKFKDLNYKRLLQRNESVSQIYRKPGVSIPHGDGGGKRFSRDQRLTAASIKPGLKGDKSLSDAILDMVSTDKQGLSKKKSEQRKKEDSKERKHSKNSHGNRKGREDFGVGTSLVDNDQDDPANVQELMQLLRMNTPLQLAQAANYSSNLFFQTPAAADSTIVTLEPPQKLENSPLTYGEMVAFRSRTRLSPLTEAADEPVPNKVVCNPPPTVSIEVNTVNQSNICMDAVTNIEKQDGSLKSRFLNSWRKLKPHTFKRRGSRQETNVEAAPAQKPNIGDVSIHEKGTSVSEVDFVQTHGTHDIGLVYNQTTEPFPETTPGMLNLNRVLPPFGSVRIGQPDSKSPGGLFTVHGATMQAPVQEAIEEQLIVSAQLCHSPALHPPANFDLTSERVRAQKVFSCPDISEATKRFLPTSLIQNTRSVPGIKVIHINDNGENVHRLRRSSSPAASRPKLTRKCGEFTKCNLNAPCSSGPAAWDRPYHFDVESKVSPVHSYFGLISSHDRGLKTSPRAFVSSEPKLPGLVPAQSSSALGDLYKPVEVSLHNTTMTPSGWPLNSLMNANPYLTSAETQLQRYSLLTPAAPQSVSRGGSPLFAPNSDESVNVSVKSGDITGNQDDVSNLSDRSLSRIYSKLKYSSGSPTGSSPLMTPDHFKKRASPHIDRNMAHSPRRTDHTGQLTIKVVRESKPYSEQDNSTQTRLTGAKSSVRFAKTKESSIEKGSRTRMSRTISRSELESVPVGTPINASPIPNRNHSQTKMKAPSLLPERQRSCTKYVSSEAPRLEQQQQPAWLPENVAIISSRSSIQELDHCGVEEDVYIDQLDSADLNIQYYPANKHLHSNKTVLDDVDNNIRPYNQAAYMEDRRHVDHMIERRHQSHVIERRHQGHMIERRHPGHLIEKRHQSHVIERKHPGHVIERRHPGYVIERRNSDYTGKEMSNEILKARGNKPPRGLPQREVRYKSDIQVHRKPYINAPTPSGLSVQHSSNLHLPVRESSTSLSPLTTVPEVRSMMKTSDEVRKRSPSCSKEAIEEKLGQMRPNVHKTVSSRSFNKTSSNNIPRKVCQNFDYFSRQMAQRSQTEETQRHEMLMRENQLTAPNEERWASFQQFTNVHRSDIRVEQFYPEDRSSNGFVFADYPSSHKPSLRRRSGNEKSCLQNQFRLSSECSGGAQAESDMPRNQNNVGNIYDVSSNSTLGQMDFENHSCNSVHTRARLRGINDVLDYGSPSRLSDPGPSRAGPTKLATVDKGKWDSRTAGKIRLTSPLQENRKIEVALETSLGNEGDESVNQQKELVVAKGPSDTSHSVHASFKDKTPSLSTFAFTYGEEQLEENEGRSHQLLMSPTLNCRTKCLRDASTEIIFPPHETNYNQLERKTSPSFHFVLNSPKSLKSSCAMKGKSFRPEITTSTPHYPVPSLLEDVVQMGEDYSVKQCGDNDDDEYVLPLSERPLFREGQSAKLWWKFPTHSADGSHSCPFSFTQEPGAVLTGCHSVPESSFLIDRGVNTTDQGAPVDIGCQCFAPVAKADKACLALKPFPSGGQLRQEENTEYRSIEERDSEYFYDAVDYRDMENNTSKDQSSDFTRSSNVDSWDAVLLGKHTKPRRPHSKDSLDGANRSKHFKILKKSKGRAFLGGGIPSELSDQRRKVKIHHGHNPNKKFALIFAPTHSKVSSSSSKKSKFTANLTPHLEEAGAFSRTSPRLVKVRSSSQDDQGLESRKTSLPRIQISRVSARTGQRYVDGKPRQDLFFDAS